MESWVSRRTVYAGSIFRVEVGEAALDDGRLATRESVVNPGGAAVVPLLGDHVVLIRQFRIVVGKALLELPAGLLEGDEDPELRARAEMEEEIGYLAEEMVPLATYYSSPGFSTERLTIFLATGLKATARKPERDERIEPVLLSLDAVRVMLQRGEIEDGKTLVGLRELLARLDASAF